MSVGSGPSRRQAYSSGCKEGTMATDVMGGQSVTAYLGTAQICDQFLRDASTV